MRTTVFDRNGKIVSQRFRGNRSAMKKALAQRVKAEWRQRLAAIEDDLNLDEVEVKAAQRALRKRARDIRTEVSGLATQDAVADFNMSAAFDA